MARILKSPLSKIDGQQDISRNFGGYILEYLRRSSKSRWINATKHKCWTYAEVADKAVAVHAALTSLGLGGGDRLCVMVAPRLEILPLFVGAACANVAFVYEEPGYPVDILVDRLESLHLAAVCCDYDGVATALELKGRLQTVKHVISMDALEDKTETSSEEYVSWSQLLSTGNQARRWKQPSVEYMKKQFCYMASTSGTTGEPKIVVHSHETLMCHIQAVSHPSHMGLKEEDVLLTPSSIGHVYALIDTTCRAVVQGASAAFLETPNIDGVLEALQHHKVSALSTVPYVARGLLEHPNLKKFDLSHLRYITSSGDYMSESVACRLFQDLNLQGFIQLYGQTEFCFISAGIYDAPPKFTSVGRLGLGVEAKVVDTATGEPVGPGELGEIVLRGLGLALGYWGRLDQTLTDSEGWYKTGDVGYYDEEEWLYVVQRCRDFFSYRGRKVAPTEIEAVLLKCPQVLDCGVVGIPDADAGGHVPHAAVVPKPGNEIAGIEYFQRYVNENVPRKYNLEGGVSIVEKIPRNKFGKLLRPQLLQQILEQQRVPAAK